MADTSSSFYTDGGSYTSGVAPPPTDNPGSGVASQAPSSFFNSGISYDAVTTVEATLAEVNAAVAQTLNNATSAAASDADAQAQASGAAASATSASTSAASATSSSASAATSATSATNSATAAAGSATSASTSAGNAATSATNAATSASAASTSATSAAGSATSAATSATNAAAAVSAAAGTVSPAMNSSALVGTSTKWAHEDHVHPSDTSRAPLASPAFTGTPTGPTATVGTNTTQLATCAFVLANGGGLLRSYLAGLTMSTAGASTTFSVASGVAADSTNAYMMTLSSALSKTTSAWAAGTSAGALDTGSIAASTWYHAYLIFKPTGPTVDVLVSLSATAPTLPSGYTVFRRLGSMKTNASSQWTLFHQLGDEFLWDVPVNDVTVSNLGLTAVLYPLSVPTGVQVGAQVYGLASNATAYDVLFTSPDQADTAPTSSLNNVRATGNAAYSFVLRTDTSARFRARSDVAATTLTCNTFGWIDRRGRDA